MSAVTGKKIVIPIYVETALRGGFFVVSLAETAV
jgi:hypothetical protein